MIISSLQIENKNYNNDHNNINLGMVRCWGGSHSGKAVAKMLPPFSGLTSFLSAINSSSKL